jgi:hypothetical protein
MTFIHIPGEAGKLPFHAKNDACCNCGEIQGIQLVETPLKRTSYMLLGGTELILNVDLPYCARCEKTATRYPKGLVAKLLVSAILFFVVMLVAVLVPFDLGSFVSSHLTLTCAIVAVLLTFTYYSFLKPTGTQTSYYQPVTLDAMKQKFMGEIVGVTLYCTNADFATRYGVLNKEFISAGFLKLKHR